MIPPTGAHTIESKNKYSCNFPYASPSYSELYCIKLWRNITVIYFKETHANLASLSAMFSSFLIPVLFCTPCQPTVIDSRINQNTQLHIHSQSGLASVSSGVSHHSTCLSLTFGYVTVKPMTNNVVHQLP